MNRKNIREAIRNRLVDFSKTAKLKTAVNSAIEHLIVYDGSLFGIGQTILIGAERMLVLNISTNDITVTRADKGTTAAIHAADTSITVEGYWNDTEINEAISDAFEAIYPSIYEKTLDSSLTLLDVYTYDLSSLTTSIDTEFGIALVEIEDETYEDLWKVKKDWVLKGETLEFLSKPGYTGERIRLTYQSKYAAPVDDIAATKLPDRYKMLIVFFACARLIEKQLNQRIRFFEYTVKSDVDAASSGDLLGTAGYNAYQYEQQLEKLKINPIGFFRKKPRF